MEFDELISFEEENSSSEFLLNDSKTTPPIIRKVLDKLDWSSPPQIDPIQSEHNTIQILRSSAIHSVICQLERLRHQLNSLSINHKLENSLSHWRNIDVTCPILIPEGSLMVIPSSLDQQSLNSSTFYQFNDNPTITDIFGSCWPGQNSINTSTQTPMDNLVSSSMLRTRLAVIHKCPDLLVPKLSEVRPINGSHKLIHQLFSETIKRLCPLFEHPIQFVCERISRCYVVSNDEFQERIEALIRPASGHDDQKLVQVSAVLNQFASIINLELKPILAEFYQRLPNEKRINIPEDLFKTPGTAALEFRFAPNKQMKIPLASRQVTKPKSLCQKQVGIKGLEVAEIRLEFDRKCQKQVRQKHPSRQTFPVGPSFP